MFQIDYEGMQIHMLTLANLTEQSCDFTDLRYVIE